MIYVIFCIAITIMGNKNCYTIANLKHLKNSKGRFFPDFLYNINVKEQWTERLCFTNSISDIYRLLSSSYLHLCSKVIFTSRKKLSYIKRDSRWTQIFLTFIFLKWYSNGWRTFHIPLQHWFWVFRVFCDLHQTNPDSNSRHM